MAPFSLQLGTLLPPASYVSLSRHLPLLSPFVELEKSKYIKKLKDLIEPPRKLPFRIAICFLPRTKSTRKEQTPCSDFYTL